MCSEEDDREDDVDDNDDDAEEDVGPFASGGGVRMDPGLEAL